MVCLTASGQNKDAIQPLKLCKAVCVIANSAYPYQMITALLPCLFTP